MSTGQMQQDEDITSAIRYLDPELRGQTIRQKTGTNLVIWVSFIVLLAGAVAFILLYLKVR